MPKYIVTGGRQRHSGENTKDWNGYDKAISIVFDSDTLSAEPFYDHTSPKDCLPDDLEASISFKSCTIYDNHLIASTQSEILKISISEKQLISIISLPVFNDVHHAFINTDNNFIVTSTGLDAVFEIDLSGKIVNEWNVLEGDIWSKFNNNKDYRKVLSTKPHVAHPNHCTEVKGEYWATRFEQKDLVNLNTKETISVPFGFPHDGLLHNDKLYFTHVNGMFSQVDFTSKKASLVFDANKLHNAKEALGWCRGIALTNENDPIIGFTRIRPTKYEKSLEWMKRKLTTKASYYGCLPTRLVKYNLSENQIDWEFDLEPHQINAVFSILPI